MDSTTRPSESTDIVPLDPRSPAQIEDAMGQLHAIENATRRQRLHLAFIYDARSLWTDDGAPLHGGVAASQVLDVVELCARFPQGRPRARGPARDRGYFRLGPVELGSAPAADRDRHA